MVSVPPAVHPKGKYGTNETCALLGINRTTLWRYTKRGLICCKISGVSGRLYYLGSDIMRFWNKF